MRLTIGIFAVLSLLGCALTASAQNPSKDQPGLAIENEYVRAVVNRGPNELGRLSIRTTEGDPNILDSKRKDLIYGGDLPWTSYTTVLMDGKAYAFGGPTTRRSANGVPVGTVTAAPQVNNGKLSTTCRFGDVEVTQELSLGRGLVTRYSDTLAVSYRINNLGDRAHSVGLRVMLDTKCGENDGAPIRTTKTDDALTAPKWMLGKDVPDFWQAFNDLAKPSAISMGTLRGGHATPPDRVLFCDWGTLADNPWEVRELPTDFTRAGEDETDTASALYWNAVTMEPGQERAYLTYYGLGSMTVTPGIGLTAPAAAAYDYERTETFAVLGYVQNTERENTARNVNVNLILPDGLELAGGSKQRRLVKEMKPGDTVQQGWAVRANGKAGGKLTIVIEAQGDNLPPVKLSREIDVAVPVAKLEFRSRAGQVPMMTDGIPTPVLLTTTLVPADSFAGVHFVLTYNPRVVKPLAFGFSVLRGVAFTDQGIPELTVDTRTPGKVIVTGMRTPAAVLQQAEADICTIKFRPIGRGDCAFRVVDAVQYIDAENKRPLDVGIDAVEIVE
jgi:hypothetical protein